MPPMLDTLLFRFGLDPVNHKWKEPMVQDLPHLLLPPGALSSPQKVYGRG